jgi:MFS family permease
MIMYISLAVGGVFAGYSYGYLEAFGWRTVFIVGGLAPIILAPLFIALLPESLVAQVLHGADPARINAILARLEPRGTFTDTTFSVDDCPRTAPLKPLLARSKANARKARLRCPQRRHSPYSLRV